MSDEQDEITRLRLREAECHDIIARLWALTDPDLISELSDLPDRIHDVLGANDENGECGNTICKQLREAEARVTALEAERDKANGTVDAFIRRLDAEIERCDKAEAEVERLKKQLEDL